MTRKRSEPDTSGPATPGFHDGDRVAVREAVWTSIVSQVPGLPDQARCGVVTKVTVRIPGRDDYDMVTVRHDGVGDPMFLAYDWPASALIHWDPSTDGVVAEMVGKMGRGSRFSRSDDEYATRRKVRGRGRALRVSLAERRSA